MNILYQLIQIKESKVKRIISKYSKNFSVKKYQKIIGPLTKKEFWL